MADIKPVGVNIVTGQSSAPTGTDNISVPGVVGTPDIHINGRIPSGNINIISGDSDGVTDPGLIIISDGIINGTAGGPAQALQIYGSWGAPTVDAPSNTGNGGWLYLEAGASSNTFTAGTLQLYGGSAYEATGTGGDVILEAGTGGATSGNSGNVFLTAGGLPGTGVRGQIRIDGRMVRTTSGSATAANDMTLSSNGNYFSVSGATTINGIASSGWGSANGAVVILDFTSNPTITHNGSPGAGFLPILLAGSTNFSVTAGTRLTLVFTTTSWKETSRTQP